MAAHAYTVAVGVGNLAVDLEVAEIRYYRNLLTGSDLLSHLVVDVGERGLAGRLHLSLAEGAAHLGEILVVDVEFKLLHAEVGVTHLTLVFKLLAQLLKLKLAGVVGQLDLTHLVACTRTEAVEVTLVAQLHLHAAYGHGLYLYIHGEVAQAGVVVELHLFDFVLFHLRLVEQLVKLGFGALKVEAEQRCAHIHAVAGLAVHLDDAGADRRVYNLLKCRSHFTRGTYARFDCSTVDCSQHNVLFTDTAAHQRHNHSNYYNHRTNCHSILDDSIAALFVAHFFWNFSVHYRSKINILQHYTALIVPKL